MRIKNNNKMIKNLSIIVRKLTKNRRQFATMTVIHNEYNFYVDFKGLLYFDDGTPFIYPNCVKDHKFVNQMYNHLKSNPSTEYPFIAEFWGEKNQIRCAISPIIFHSLDKGQLKFSFQQEIAFQPENLKIEK